MEALWKKILVSRFPSRFAVGPRYGSIRLAMGLFSSSFIKVAGGESYGETRFLGGRISFMRVHFYCGGSVRHPTPPRLTPQLVKRRIMRWKNLSCHSNSLSIDFILKGSFKPTFNWENSAPAGDPSEKRPTDKWASSFPCRK
jgi:hypothetical protein